MKYNDGKRRKEEIEYLEKKLVKELAARQTWLRKALRDFLSAWDVATRDLDFYVETPLWHPKVDIRLYLVAGEGDFMIWDSDCWQDWDASYSWEEFPAEEIKKFLHSLPDLMKEVRKKMQGEIDSLQALEEE